MLLLWGASDQSVGRFNMDKLEGKIRERGGCVETKIYADADHIWILGDLSWIGHNKYNVLKDWVTYLNRTTCKK
jgi:dienelactone hydrolase